MVQHSGVSPGGGLAPGTHSPGSALPAAMHPVDEHSAAEHSNGMLHNEASFTETDHAPVTPPTLGKLSVSVDTQATQAQSRSWFGYFLGYQASTTADTGAAEAPQAAAPTTASDAAADIRRYSSRGNDPPEAEKSAADNVRIC